MADQNEAEVTSDKSDSTSKARPSSEIPPTESDPELDDLLDSALEDFDKKPEPSPAAAAAAAPLPINATPSSAPSSDPGAFDASALSNDAMFNEIFSSAMSEEMHEMSPDMQQMMKAMMGGQGEADDLFKQFEQFAQSSTSATPGASGESKQNFADTLQQTLGSLAQNAEELQGDMSEDEIMKMMSTMGLGGEGAGGDFMPMMENMMKSLLSKDVLYPSLKEITSKYPAWLQENKGKVADDLYDKYVKQNELMGIIVNEFDQEKDTDSEAVKKDRFERIMNVMQDMQQLGQPPQEIVGEMPPGLDLDANGVPKFPGQDQCSVM